VFQDVNRDYTIECSALKGGTLLDATHDDGFYSGLRAEPRTEFGPRFEAMIFLRGQVFKLNMRADTGADLQSTNMTCGWFMAKC